MSIEQRRKQLMANQPQWGDVPSPRSASNGAREESPPLVATRGSAQGIAALKALDALIMKDPKDRVKRANADNNPTISFSCKGWTMESLLRLGKNFAEVPRVRWSPATSISEQISSHETTSPGVPLVVEGLHNNPRWIGEKFTPEWLERNGPKDISARNVHDRLDQRITLSAFITRSREISPFATPEEAERLYGKDVACPEEWENFLHDGEIIPASLSPNGPNNLIKNLPESDRPETLMCYLGVGDTFTPCHKDLCASSGHNLMCYTENGGSSFWFMTATSSANAAAEYFHDRLSHELDHETHVITVEQLARTPFKVYITEQKLGDLVLVPPRSCHQVVNAGGITIKTSWSRMTLDGLSLALRYELPLYRRVCRSEVYRVKSTIYYTLLQTIDTVSKLLRKQPARSTGSRNAVASTSQKDMPTQLRTLIRVLLLFDSILIEEYSQRSHNMRNLSSENEGDTDEIGQLTCDFCGGDVFQSFFECRTCVDGPRRAAPGGGLIVCPGCYVEGRTCGCETMIPMQCRSFDELLNARARAVELFNACSELQHQAIIHIVPSKEELLADDKIGLFRAALVLRKRRLDLVKLKEKKDGPRRCTVARDRELNHESSWILKCDKCHSAMCFAHMVWERQLHSAEAFLAHEKDKNQVTFHKVHMETKKRFNTELAALKLEELDKLPPTGVQLAYLAATFSTCKPVHPNQKLRKAGYYDLTVWENDFPDNNIADHMPAESQRPSSSKGSSARSKRMVMDCILLTPRPQKRKERAVERSGSPIIVDEVNDGNDAYLPPQKRSKRTHSFKGSTSRIVVPERDKARKLSRWKNVICINTSSSESDSEDEQPAKKPRADSRTSKSIADLRFETRGPIASSVADAFNNASVQNSKATPKVSRHCPSSSHAPAMPLPRRKRKVGSAAAGHSSAVVAAGHAFSSGSPAIATSSDIGGQLAAIQETLSTVQRTQAQQAAEVTSMRHNRHSNSTMAALERTFTTETTVKIMADLVTGIVSAFQGQGQHSTNHPISRAWPARGRGRGRGGILLGDHPHRSMPPNNQELQDYREYRPFPDYRSTRYSTRERYRSFPPSFPNSSRHTEPEPGRYSIEQRIWFPGPHAQSVLRRYDSTEDRIPRETRELRRKRNWTRFSPPTSPEGLDLIPLPGHRYSRDTGGRDPHFQDMETASDASGTVTNTDGPSTNTPRLTAPQPARRDKFFASLHRSPSPSVGPADTQDWEVGYEKDTDRT